MAGPLALALVLGLASLTFVMAPLTFVMARLVRAIHTSTAANVARLATLAVFLALTLPLPSAVTERTAGLAPALLAALVAIQLTGPNGFLHLDVKVPAVLLAAVLAALRAPFIVCVIASALVAALLRALFHL